MSSWCFHLLLFITYFDFCFIVLCNLRTGKPVILFPLNNNILLLLNNYSAIPLSSVTDPVISLRFRIPLFNSIRIWILLYKKVIYKSSVLFDKYWYRYFTGVGAGVFPYGTVLTEVVFVRSIKKLLKYTVIGRILTVLVPLFPPPSGGGESGSRLTILVVRKIFSYY